MQDPPQLAAVAAAELRPLARALPGAPDDRRPSSTALMSSLLTTRIQ